jgi:hypothetical protein
LSLNTTSGNWFGCVDPYRAFASPNAEDPKFTTHKSPFASLVGASTFQFVGVGGSGGGGGALGEGGGVRMTKFVSFWGNTGVGNAAIANSATSVRTELERTVVGLPRRLLNLSPSSPSCDRRRLGRFSNDRIGWD